MPKIQIINRTRRIRDARFLWALPGLQMQVSRDFAPKWGIGAELVFVPRREAPNPSDWKLWLFDTSDLAGALGYHEDDSGIPEGKIFVEDDLKYGAEITVTMSHEILEMLADPTTMKTAPGSQPGLLYAIEVCDPVEADGDGYLSGAVRVSNFVLPAYFGLRNADGSKGWDFLGQLPSGAPTMRPGGYLLYFQNGAWHSTMQRHEDGTLSGRSVRSEGRSTKRARALAP